MKLTKKRQKEIDEKINELHLNTQTSYPEDSLLEILKKMGILVYKYDFSKFGDKVSGAILVKDDKAKILINNNESRQRINFTIAHELGHLVLHKENKLRIDSYNYINKNSLDETEANYFAASLLMPKEKFLKTLSEARGDIEAVAEYFAVSKSAVSTREQWLKTN